MKKVNITINGQKITVKNNSLIIDAAETLGIEIPTLCHIQGEKPFTSCMVCMVKDNYLKRLIPACSTRVEENMDISTDCEEVQHLRKAAIELLLSEHLGDCEAPCRMICPASLNIPLIIRDIQQGDIKKALTKITENIPIPKTISLICNAPCEKGCRRKQKDAPLAIRSLIHYVAFNSTTRKQLAKFANTDLKIAIIGSGPTGLSTAWYLLQKQYRCVIFEKNSQIGGGLRKIPETTLPSKILNEEITLFQNAGCEFRTKTAIDYLNKNILLKLKSQFDAIVIATGTHPKEQQKNIEPEKWLFHTDNTMPQTQQAIRGIANGKKIARKIDIFLKKNQKTPQKIKTSNSRLGTIKDEEIDEFMKTASPANRLQPENTLQGFTKKNAKKESDRCLHCDCSKPKTCKLRKLANKYEAQQKHYNTHIKRTDKLTRNIDEHFIYEPGKCIKCGICVRICAKFAEKKGMTFTGRSYNTKVTLPFNAKLTEGMGKAIEECIKKCPTGALSTNNSSL